MADQARHDKGAKQPYQTKPILSSKLVTSTGVTILWNNFSITEVSNRQIRMQQELPRHTSCAIRLRLWLWRDFTPSWKEGDYFNSLITSAIL